MNSARTAPPAVTRHVGSCQICEDADEAPAGFDLWALPYGDPLWVEVKALSRDGEAFLDLVREVGEES